MKTALKNVFELINTELKIRLEGRSKDEVRIKVIDILVLNDNAKIVNIYGQESQKTTRKGVDGFHVDFIVSVSNGIDDTVFLIAYQSTDRNGSVVTYSGVEMSIADGCIDNESEEFIEYVDEIFDESFYSSHTKAVSGEPSPERCVSKLTIDLLEIISSGLCRRWLNEQLANEVKD